jgi:hypothetical protein
MWIYRNLVVHDSVTGTQALRRKEALQVEIERQIELGGEGLAEGDQWMLEVNWNDIEESTGEREAYWLLAIEAAREYNAKKAAQGFTIGYHWRGKVIFTQQHHTLQGTTLN